MSIIFQIVVCTSAFKLLRTVACIEIDVKTLDYGLGFQRKSCLVLRIHNWADRWNLLVFVGFFALGKSFYLLLLLGKMAETIYLYSGKSLVVFASAIIGTITYLLCIAPHHLSTIRLGLFKPGVAPVVIKFIFQSSIILNSVKVESF